MPIQVKPRGTAPQGEGGNALEVTVSDLSNRLKRTVEDAFGSVRVRGEISGYRGPVSSGHMYFSLKDDRSAIDAVVWRGVAGKLAHRPEEGLEVIASGKLTTYPGRSKYQIVIDQLEPAGEGALMAQLERLRKKLAGEGLFAAERKRPLPFMPRVVGVVTSPTGSVIRDILHRVSERCPVHVLVWPVRVQGETTPEEVARAIMGFNKLDGTGAVPRPEVLVVARGGGSLEDLWGFNDELVVRAAAASVIPLVSAVGHETDTTLIDHAADMRAPTPTAAAEFVVPVRANEEARVAERAARLSASASRGLQTRRERLAGLSRGLQSPDMMLALPRRRFDDAAGRLGRALERRTERARARFERVAVAVTPVQLVQSMGRRRERLVLAERLGVAALARAMNGRRDALHLRSREARRAIGANLRGHERGFASIARTLRPRSLQAGAERTAKRFSKTTQRFELVRSSDARARRTRLDASARLLESLSFKGVLARGFAVIRDASGVPLRGVHALASGQELSVEMQDGRVDAVVTDGAAGARARSSTSSKARTERGTQPKAVKPHEATEQGDLF